MTNYSETDITVEKVFSRYIQTCLYHSSRDYYRKCEKDSRHIQSLYFHTNHQQFTVDIQLESFEENFILQENVRGAIQSLSQKDREFVYH